MSRDSSRARWPQAIVTLTQIVGGAALLVALSWGRIVLMPIALAVLLTFLLNPIVRRLQGLGLGRCVSTLLAVSIAGGLLTVVGVAGSRQVSTMLATLPENTAKIVAKLKTMKALVSGPTAQRFEQMIEEISREIQVEPRSSTADPNASSIDAGSAESTDAQTKTQSIDRVVVASESLNWAMLTGPLGTAVEGMAMLAFAVVLLIFFLMDREGLRDRIVLLAGKTRLTVTSKALEDATNRVSRYIEMLAIVNGGFGLLLTIGLFLLGVPYAILWGCLGAMLRFIPYLGPWIGAIFPIVMSLAMFDGWWQPLAVIGFVLVLELVTNNVVEPLAFGHMTGVAPSALLISAAFWLFLWGPIGLVLSAPFAVSLVVIGKNVPQLSFLYVLLADQPALSDAAGFYQRLLLQDRQVASTILTNRLRDADTETVFDQLVIPVLVQTKRDEQRGHLTDEECDNVLRLLNDLLSTIDAQRTQQRKTPPSNEDVEPYRRLYLLGYSFDSDVDRTALTMLNILLDESRWALEIVPDGTLMSEVVARVAADPPAAICITAIPPGGVTHARFICQKLRAVSKDMPLLVGRWGARRIQQSDRARLLEAGASGMAISLLETRKWLDARYPVLSSQVEAECVDPRPKDRNIVHAGSNS